MQRPPELRGNFYHKLAGLNTWTKLCSEAALEPDLPILDSHHLSRLVSRRSELTVAWWKVISRLISNRAVMARYGMR